MSPGSTYQQTLAWARTSLSKQDIQNPRLEAEVLLAHLLGKPRSHLLAWPERELNGSQQQAYATLIERRCKGEPIAYITGQREFWSLAFRVNPSVLIPRPDTELLVELALTAIPRDAEWRIADLGTGSGAIAAAIASERPACRLLATDLSPEALDLAQTNFSQLGLERPECRRGDWCNCFRDGEGFELILSNPPYIPAQDPHLQQGDLPAEPLQALASGPDGLDDLRRICSCSPAWLSPAGWLMLEHGFDQGRAVRELLCQAGLGNIRSHRDMEGRERVTVGRKQ